MYINFSVVYLNLTDEKLKNVINYIISATTVVKKLPLHLL